MTQGVDILKQITDLEGPITLHPFLLWSAFVLMFLVFIVFSTILFYHWRKYDWHNSDVRRAGAIYLSGAFVIFVILFFIIISLD